MRRRSKLDFVFQGGKRRHIVIAPTAGNVVTNLSPAAGWRWQILHGLINLTCDATVANRTIRIRLTDGTTVSHQVGISGATTASATRNLAVRSGYAANGGGTEGDLIAFGLLIIEGADQLRVLVDAGVAGDSYNGIITVLEAKA